MTTLAEMKAQMEAMQKEIEALEIAEEIAIELDWTDSDYIAEFGDVRHSVISERVVKGIVKVILQPLADNVTGALESDSFEARLPIWYLESMQHMSVEWDVSGETFEVALAQPDVDNVEAQSDVTQGNGKVVRVKGTGKTERQLATATPPPSDAEVLGIIAFPFGKDKEWNEVVWQFSCFVAEGDKSQVAVKRYRITPSKVAEFASRDNMLANWRTVAKEAKGLDAADVAVRSKTYENQLTDKAGIELVAW